MSKREHHSENNCKRKNEIGSVKDVMSNYEMMVDFWWRLYAGNKKLVFSTYAWKQTVAMLLGFLLLLF